MYVLKFESDIYNLFLLQPHTCKGLMFCYWKPLVLFSIQIFFGPEKVLIFHAQLIQYTETVALC